MNYNGLGVSAATISATICLMGWRERDARSSTWSKKDGICITLYVFFFV